jgi:ABC-type nickel/cobalt efflux system permease component RcnA
MAVSEKTSVTYEAANLEWAIGDILVIGFAIWQIISVRRSLRRDREREESAQQVAPPDSRPAPSVRPNASPPPLG